MRRVVAMIHVPDVRATVEWYTALGFSVGRTNAPDGVMDWALLRLGDSELMFSEGGAPSAAHRREVDLYIETDDVDALYHRLRHAVDVVEPPHDTFYGMREVIIRDVNRFWITFGQPTV